MSRADMLATIAAAQCIAYAQRKRAGIEYAMRALDANTSQERYSNPDEPAYPKPTSADHEDAMRHGPDCWLWAKFEFGKSAMREDTIERYVKVLDKLPAEWTAMQFAEAAGLGQGCYFAVGTLVKRGIVTRRIVKQNGRSCSWYSVTAKREEIANSE